MFFNHLVRHGSRQLHSVSRTLRRKGPEVKNQRVGADVIDHDRDAITFNRQVSIAELHEKRVQRAVSSPAEDSDVPFEFDKRCLTELIPRVCVAFL